MRKWLSLQNDNPSDVSVTTLKASLNRRPPVSSRKFFNSLQMTPPAFIASNTPSYLALVTQNMSRALLILQNTSYATAAGDVAPTMYFGFGMIPAVGRGLALPPGVGMVLDVRVPCDTVYVALGASVNTGGSVVIAGIVQEGGIANPELDTVNISESGQIALLLQQLLGKLNAGG